MDFLETANLLMDIQAKQPNMRYSFMNGYVNIVIDIDDDVEHSFNMATRLFEPVE